MNAQGIALIGYDVESRYRYGDYSSAKSFINKAYRLHSDLSIPCTAFILGETILDNRTLFKNIKQNPLWDFQQHTFSHIALKDVIPVNEKWKSANASPLEEIESEIQITNKLLSETFNKICRGLSAPKGFYGGLQDREDIIRLLKHHGIKFVRSFTRGAGDWQEVPFDVQPFWYCLDGVKSVLEIPSQGWQETIWRRNYGWDNNRSFFNYLKDTLDHVVDNNLVWSIGFHDWTLIKTDPNLEYLEDFYNYAISRGMKFMTHLDYYLEKKLEDGIE